MSEYKDEKNPDTLMDLIRDPSKKKNSARNELAFIFRDVLFELRIGPPEWDVLVEKYARARYDGDRKKIAQEKINLARAISKPELTWQRFMEAMSVLGYDVCDISIKLLNRGAENNSRDFKVRVPNRYKKRGDNNGL